MIFREGVDGLVAGDAAKEGGAHPLAVSALHLISEQVAQAELGVRFREVEVGEPVHGSKLRFLARTVTHMQDIHSLGCLSYFVEDTIRTLDSFANIAVSATRVGGTS